ncbi:MAG: hypothetical protein A2Y15_04260 [Clostridiales bacterium GWF2_36_10]|nr:MAG: hypothetical protein A2Y15_04260 [Clostridiales bacterium GWF2_36_10]
MENLIILLMIIVKSKELSLKNKIFQTWFCAFTARGAVIRLLAVNPTSDRHNSHLWYKRHGKVCHKHE